VFCKESVLPYFDKIMELIGSALVAADTNPTEEVIININSY
jgi:hypothetical protein